MELQRVPVGPIGTNCYFFTDGAGHGGIVDPGAEGERLLALVVKMRLIVDAIFLTHGHYDHTGGVDTLRAALGCPVYLHCADQALLGHEIMPAIGPTTAYSEGMALPVGSLCVEVFHTPGHTPGGVTLRVEDVLFTGDTLFKGSMGRTDLPGGSYNALMASLRTLGGLSGDYRVLPGHEESSTLAAERRENFFLREAMEG